MLNLTVEVPENEANGSENVTIVNEVLSIEVNFTVFVSEYGISIMALDDHETAGPGENVTYVFEVRNTGTLDTAADFTVTDIRVEGGDVDRWTGKAQTDISQLILFTNDVSHVRLNVSIPNDADPNKEVAHFTVQLDSPTARAAGTPLVVEEQVHLTISNYGFYGEPDMYEKEVIEDTWVQFDMKIWNSGGTDVHVTYNVYELPATWEQVLQTYPDDGWLLTSEDPVEFYMRLKPKDVLLDERYRPKSRRRKLRSR